MNYSRKRLLAGQWITADLKSENFTEAELKEFRDAHYPVHQGHLADAEMAEARQQDMEQAVGRIRKHGPGLPLLSRNFAEMPREEIEALAVQLSEDGSIICRYLDRALEEIAALRADVEAEYELVQALLRARNDQ